MCVCVCVRVESNHKKKRYLSNLNHSKVRLREPLENSETEKMIYRRRAWEIELNHKYCKGCVVPINGIGYTKRLIETSEML